MQLLGRHFHWDVCPTSYVAKAVSTSSSLILKSDLSMFSVLVDGITPPCPTFNHHGLGNFPPKYFSNPSPSFHPNYLPTTYPSSSLYPKDLFVYPSVFQGYHNSLLIIFPVFSFFLLKSTLHRAAGFAYLRDEPDHVSFLVQNFPKVSEQGIHVLL